MRALVADGRPAEALAAFERLRQTLADELGTDPSAALQELHLAVLRGEVAPAKPAPVGRDTLPAALTSFVGREDQQKRIAELLTSSRLITLVGPGGAGKTRLAIESGRTLRETGPARDGIWLAELAPVVNPDDVAQAIYDGIGVREAALLERAGQSARDVIDRLVEVLSDRSAVLIVDNCEHVLEAAAQVTTTLLARCPRLRVITTSREPLGVVGETLVPVPPLEQPAEDSLDPADYPAMRLFADRAAAVAPDFALTPDVAGSGGRDRPPAGRAAAGDRAGRGPDAVDAGGADRGPALGPVPAAGRRQPRGRRPAPHAAGGRRVELGAARARGARRWSSGWRSSAAASPSTRRRPCTAATTSKAG